MRRLPSLPSEREGFAAPEGVRQARAAMAAMAANGAWVTTPPPCEAWLGGVRALRFVPAGAARARMLHFHGGGFRQGQPEWAGPYARALADACGIEVLAVHYRLAPEHPFPAGLNDGLSVLRALAGAGLPLLVAGDSAGGGIAAGLAALSAEGAAPAVTGVVLHSPWLDLTLASPGYERNAASDPLFSREAARLAADLYLQGGDPAHPLVSPLFAAGAGWAPTLLSVGTGEVLADDATGLYQRLRLAGADCTLLPVAGMEHVAVMRGKDQVGARETFDATVRFVAACLG